MGKEGVKGAVRTQHPYWYYLGGETFTNPDGQQLNVPSEATIIQIASEDNKTYWAIGVIANANSPGYVPTDSVQTLGPAPSAQLSNGVWVHGTSAITHIAYWKEV